MSACEGAVLGDKTTRENLQEKKHFKNRNVSYILIMSFLSLYCCITGEIKPPDGEASCHIYSRTLPSLLGGMP